MPHELGGPGTMGVADLLLGTGPVVQVVLWTLVALLDRSWGIILYKLSPDFARPARVRALYRDLLGIQEPRRDSYCAASA